MYARRLLLAALFLPALTLFAPQQGRFAPSGAPERYHLYVMQVGGTWMAYGGSGGRVFSAMRSVQEPDGLTAVVPTFGRESGCWWLWLIFTGKLRCS